MDNLDQYLTVKEFCKIVGASRATVWRWQKAGVIKGKVIAGRVLFTEQDVAAFKLRHAPDAIVNAAQPAGSLHETLTRIATALETIARSIEQDARAEQSA